MKKYVFFLVLLLSIQLLAQSKYKEEWRSIFVGQAPTRFGTEPSTPLTIQSQMDSVAWAGFNTVIVPGGFNCLTAFKSDIALKTFGVSQQPAPAFTVQDYLRNAVIEAHRNGLEIFFTLAQTAGHALNDSTYESDYGYDLMKMKPEWVWRKKNGKIALLGEQGPTYFSAIHPGMQEYMIGTVMEAFRKYDFDGYSINDDFISSPVCGGYEAHTVNLYKQEHNNISPPDDYNNEDWIRWRANKINDFTKRLRDSIKTFNKNLFLNTSPCTYPWCYYALIQDSKTWIENGWIEEYSPQFGFETSDPLPEYRRWMDKTINDLIPLSQKNVFTPCIKTYGGLDPKVPMKTEYIDSVNNYQQKKGITAGNYFFYYEHMRLNNQELLKKIKNVMYKEPAIPYFRKGNVWRPKAVTTTLYQPEAVIKGKWQKRDDIIGLYSSKAYAIEDANKTGVGNASIEYSFHVPLDAYYEVYTYTTANWQNTYSATYTAYSTNDSINVIQKQYAAEGLHYPGTGWQKIADVYLKKGVQKVLKLTNKGIGSNKIVVADAAMIMINRKLSPNVTVNEIEQKILLPEKPILLSPTSNASNIFSSTKFVWNKTPWAARYQYMLASDNSFTNIIATDTILVDTFKTVSGLLPNTKYYWKVKGKNVTGIGEWSESGSFTTTQISAPTNLTIQRTGLKEVTLQWNDNANNEDGYVIERKQTQNSSFTFLDTLKGSNNKYIDKKVEQGLTYFYRIKAYIKGMESGYSNEAIILLVGVDSNELPTEYSLSQNYPNPFNPSTTIHFQIPIVDALSHAEVQVALKIYDVLGREIATLVNEEKQPGYYEILFDATNLSSGIYYYKLTSGSFIDVKKMILVK